MSTFDAGYSKNPLHKKLGCKPDRPVYVLGAPDGFLAYLTEHGFEAHPIDDTSDVPPGAGHVHIFTTEAAVLIASMAILNERLDRAGQVWLSWPKKASKVKHDIDKPLLHKPEAFGDFVDVKVCAINEVWSGLKYMIRKERR